MFLAPFVTLFLACVYIVSVVAADGSSTSLQIHPFGSRLTKQQSGACPSYVYHPVAGDSTLTPSLDPVVATLVPEKTAAAPTERAALVMATAHSPAQRPTCLAVLISLPS
jgi:hypothetical protein